MDIVTSPSGKVLKIPTGYKAFMPDPLPPKIEWDNTLVSSLSKADYYLGMLSREGGRLPNPYLLVRPFMAREAVLSSKIEGTQTTLGEMLASEAGDRVNRDPDDMQEIHNYIQALEYGRNRLKDLPLSLRLIMEIHGRLMQGVRGSHATPGEFRRSQNWIGTPGSILTTAKYVPPPPEKLMEALGDFELFLHDKTLPTLIHIALCHYQFEAIHPFLDGNGRMGRLLITLLLIERQILPTPLLSLSAFFEATRDDYYKHLYQVSSQGSWNDWLTYFLNGVALQSTDVLSRIERINSLISDWQIKAGGELRGTLQNVLKHLASNPYLTIKKVAETYTISFTTAQRAIMKLEELGIISQTSIGKRDRVFCALPILKILEEPTTIHSFNQD